MKKIVASIAALMTACLAVVAFAAGSVSGKVASVDGVKVTVKVDGAVPAWVKAGSTVKASGGAPTVVSVKGHDVVLKFGKAKAAKIKPNSSMTIHESSGDEMQGC